MKRKVGEIYDKPIVVGNKNEVEKHEIHIDDLVSEGEGTEVDIDDLLSGSCFYEKIHANLTTKELFDSPNASVCADEEGYDSVFKVTRQKHSHAESTSITAHGNHKFDLRYILDTGEDKTKRIENEVRQELARYMAYVHTERMVYPTNSFVEISSPTGKKYKIYLEVVE